MYNFKQIVELPAGGDLPPKEAARLQKMFDEMIEHVFTGGYPRGYDPKPVGVPQQRCCYGSIIHAPNCKTWGVAT